VPMWAGASVGMSQCTDAAAFLRSLITEVTTVAESGTLPPG
jgi:hypothetical protein